MMVNSSNLDSSKDSLTDYNSPKGYSMERQMDYSWLMDSTTAKWTASNSNSDLTKARRWDCSWHWDSPRATSSDWPTARQRVSNSRKGSMRSKKMGWNSR
jgi:hypothetical protein